MQRSEMNSPLAHVLSSRNCFFLTIIEKLRNFFYLMLGFETFTFMFGSSHPPHPDLLTNPSSRREFYAPFEKAGSSLEVVSARTTMSPSLAMFSVSILPCKIVWIFSPWPAFRMKALLNFWYPFLEAIKGDMGHQFFKRAVFFLGIRDVVHTSDMGHACKDKIQITKQVCH